jgi:hypothetical protein
LRWPAALLTRRRRAFALFISAELTLALAIPFLVIAGYHTLLESRAGRFVEQPTEAEPGWRALVDPSPLAAVVEVADGRPTGIVLLAAHNDDTSGGTMILVPGTLNVEGVPLSARAPDDALVALSDALRLRFTTSDVVDHSRWSSVLGDTTYLIDNPDPVVDGAGQRILAVGPVEIGAANASMFLGLPAPGSNALSLLYRRNLFWSALVRDPPRSDDPLAATVAEISGPAARVVELPLAAMEPPLPDLVATEQLIREVVPVPAGASPGDRLRVRIIDRTGLADLPAVAAEVAATGSEGVEIGNAVEFDGGQTELVIPVGVEDPGITDLAMLTGATTVHNSGFDADPIVTLVVGADFTFVRS